MYKGKKETPRTISCIFGVMDRLIIHFVKFNRRISKRTKPMNPITRNTLFAIGLLILIYLVIAFVYLEFDITEWSKEQRGGLVGAWVVSSVVSYAAMSIRQCDF